MGGPVKMNINSWPDDDRPREKMMRLGAGALSNAELLAILIGSGSTEESAVGLMQRLLADCKNNLNTLGKKTLGDLTAYKGMGPAKALAIMAACEVGRRRALEKAEERALLNSSEAIYGHMHPIMQDLDVEEAWALYLNQGCRLIKAERISRGGLSETSIDVRLVMRSALLCNATVVAICHNHPSGNTSPSSADDRITQAVAKACSTMRIHFADHLVVTDGAYYSYRDEGRL